MPLMGYNSHGIWSPLKEILKIERERENYIDPLLKKLKPETMAIWVCLNRADAAKYNMLAGDIDIRKPNKEELANVEGIELVDGQLWTSMDDGDGGYLFTSNN